MAREDKRRADHLEKPGRKPIDRLLAPWAASLEWDNKILVAEFIDRDRQVG
ncbi:MAG: hypothetical protein QOD62_262, partial [Actinomycetota bacterium]|nr:hypothetical protein [Actinomycetota bacterium]